METTVKTKEFLDLCKNVGPFVHKRPTHSYVVKTKDRYGKIISETIPFHSFRIRLASNKLFLAANNGKSSIEMCIDVDYDGDHVSFFISSEKIIKTLPLIKPESIKISFLFENEQYVFVVDASGQKYKSTCIKDDGDSFLINCRPKTIKSMDFFLFKQVLSKNLGIAPKNPTDVDRFKGVYLFLKEDGLYGAATDAYMGSLFKNEHMIFNEDQSFCIEEDGCRLICGIKSEYDCEPVVVHFGEDSMALNIGERAIVATRFIDSQKMDPRVYYGNPSTRIKVNSNELLRSLNRLKEYVGDDKKQIRICFENEKMVLCAEKETSHLPFSGTDFSVLEKTSEHAAIEVLMCDYEGPAIFVMFNIFKLINVISLIKSEALLFCDMNNGIRYGIVPDQDIIGTEQRCLLAKMLTPQEMEERNKKKQSYHE